MLERYQLDGHFVAKSTFWAGVTFTLGSTAWIVSGYLLFVPLTRGASSNAGAGWAAFIGETLFVFGSYLMLVGALNAEHEEDFGAALRALIRREGRNDVEKAEGSANFQWIGWTSWRDMRFSACLVQLAASVVYWIGTITGIPGVVPDIYTNPPRAIADIFYWTPQLVGGIFLAVSYLLFMLDEQHGRLLPDLTNAGWHAALWNLVGAIGFALCGALGYGSYSSGTLQYQSALSTFWASWVFLIGSLIHIWQALWEEGPSVASRITSEY